MISLCPFLMIAHAAASDGRISTECMRERCAMWDACITERNGVQILSGFKAGCGLIPRENRGA